MINAIGVLVAIILLLLAVRDIVVQPSGRSEDPISVTPPEAEFNEFHVEDELELESEGHSTLPEATQTDTAGSSRNCRPANVCVQASQTESLRLLSIPIGLMMRDLRPRVGAVEVEVRTYLPELLPIIGRVLPVIGNFPNEPRAIWASGTPV